MFFKVWEWVRMCVLVSLVFFGQIGFSQNLRMRSLTVNDGLPQGLVPGIAQDKQGFIWIASEGLSRFDGHNFVYFRHSSADTSSITSNQIDYMRMDDRNNLWLIYASREVDVFNTVTCRVRHISDEKAYRWLSPVPNEVYYIGQEDGRYFAASLTSLTFFDPWGMYKKEIPLLPGEALLALGATRGHTILVSTDRALYEIRNSRLFRTADFPPASEEAVGYIQGAVKYRSRIPGRILEGPGGILVIPGVGCIYRYDRNSGQIQSLSAGGMRVPWNMTQVGGYIFTNTGNGLIRFGERGAVTQLTRSADVLLTDVILYDRSGVLWAATAGAVGLRLFDLRPVNFRSYRYANGFFHDVLEPWIPNPMGNHIAYGSYEGRCAKDKDGRVWVVSYIYTGERNEITAWKGSVWPGSGVYRFNKNGISKWPLRIPGGKVKNIAFDGDNQCWLITADTVGAGTHLVKLDLLTGMPILRAGLPADLTENWYLTATENRICVLMENELRLYDTAATAYTTFTRKQLRADGMLLMALPDLHDTSILWLATRGSGIIRLNIKTRQMVHYTESNGLPNNTVYYMARDKRGFFWCSSNKGIFRFDPSTGATMSFLVKDGLQGNEFNRYHFMETPDGHFIFGGTEGYSVFHPDSVSIDHYQTPVVISGILVNNLPVQEAVHGLKDSLANFLQQLTLAHDQNFLSVRFAGLQYNAPEENHYRYLLQGLDKEWVDGGTDANARYAYIPPGHYTFMVNASNTSGLWSNQIKTLNITVLPPWWKTGWAYALYVLVIAYLAYALYLNWLHRAKDRQRIVLQQKEAEHLKAMDEMKSRFFSNITHEFRTPLSLIIEPVVQMQSDVTEPKFRQRLSSVQRNAEQLLQLINQLLDTAKLEAGNMHINLHRGNLSQFIGGIAGSFASHARVKQLTLTCELPEGNAAEHSFDADKLRKIVQNLLDNAIKFTAAGGYVTIRSELESVSDTSDILQVSVEDSGIGIPADKLPHIFTRFYQVHDDHTRTYSGTGIGLALVKELLELMGGTIAAINNPAAENGMLFTMRLPIAKAAGEETGPPPEDAGTMVPAYSGIPAEQGLVLAEPGSAKPLVLVVEDHEELNAFICSTFIRSCRVLSARNGKEGWKLAQQELPDVIISDVMMPEMDGREFCRMVKTTPGTSHIAFVMLTARSSQGNMVEGLESRADDYIIKPFHADELQLRIRNILDHRQQLRSFYNRQLTVAEEPLRREEKIDLFLQQVYRQVEEHMDDVDFTAEKLAASVAVSTRTLVRKLNAVAGITPMELVRQYRMKRAAELLIEGKPVSEVAWSVGYETRNYFSTAFKAFYGITPSEYGKTKRNQ